MNSNFDGVNGLYGSVQIGALAELGRLLNKTGQGQGRKHKVLMTAACVIPLVLLLVGRMGS